MIIAVGSINETKLLAVRSVIRGMPSRIIGYKMLEEDEIRGYDVSSEVREQPFGPDETMRGAINRASQAFSLAQSHGDCRLGIGIESGLFEAPLLMYPDGSARYEERTYCILSLGNLYAGDQRYFFGSSAGFEHPKAVTDCVLREKVDISEAYRKCGFTDSPKIGAEKGCVNILTKGRVTRDQEIADAVIRAMIAFENREWYMQK